MMVREGAVSTGLGTVVAAAGATLAAMKVAPLVSAGIVGFGLARIVMGAVEQARRRQDFMRNSQIALNEFS